MATFTITRGLVGVESDHTSEPFLVRVKRQRVAVFDIEFFEFSMHDRKLARALGLDCNKRAPFDNTTLIYHLKKLRNRKVDQLIMQSLKDDDPMASIEDDADPDYDQRARKFAEAHVKQVIEIHVTEFTRENGDVVPEKTLKVYSTPRRDSILTLEFSDANLTWLSVAIRMQWDAEGAPRVKRGVDDDAQLPPLLNSEVCKYKCRGGKFIISAWYRLMSGVYKEISKSLGDYASMDQETLEIHIRSCETSVMHKWKANHHEAKDEDE